VSWRVSRSSEPQRTRGVKKIGGVRVERETDSGRKNRITGVNSGETALPENQDQIRTSWNIPSSQRIWRCVKFGGAVPKIQSREVTKICRDN
jgi:hypothetical protein